MQAVLTPHPPSSLHTYLHHDYHLPHAYSIHNTCIMIRSHALEILIPHNTSDPPSSLHTYYVASKPLSSSCVL